MKYFISSKAFTLLELMIVTAILAILMAIAIPNFISYRNKTFCTQAETDAMDVAAAISDYFGTANRTDTPDIKDLKITLFNEVKIIGTDPNECITIQVTDRARRCPLDYQGSLSGWDRNYVYTLEIK